ncbi:LysR substrate-binding domain-containing protein [Paraburkholderia phosphatilytica]|uniref:LysR substrate-binding domain-containing protein n=1 Tax=Paraburkholderia phosphatilytica TaxID=2282883 RepID=UPI000E4F3FB5|nr:LysR substrate-binding domain-containing protein [Paraburkholderia phosphatilytica]
MAKLNAKQMEVFVAVMAHGSITAAAQHLNVSQPAVSRMIERFEHEAGFVAFERRRGKLVPTPESEIFFAEVTQVYRGLEYLNEVARDIGGARRGYLRVGVFPAFAEAWIGERITRYVADREDVLTSLIPMSTDSVFDAVSRQAVDLGIALRASDREGIRSEEICVSEIVCIVPKGHRLTGKQLIQPADLSGEDFISMSSKVKARTSIDAIFDSSGVERRIRAEAPWASTVCHLVAQGLGVSLVIRESAEEFAHLGYHMAAFRPRVDYRAYLISSTARPLPAVAQGFRDLLLLDYHAPKKRGVRAAAAGAA